MLVDFEREHTKLQERNEELETNIKQMKQLESRHRNNELKVHDLNRRLSETERLRRDLEGKVCIQYRKNPKNLDTRKTAVIIMKIIHCGLRID